MSTWVTRFVRSLPLGIVVIAAVAPAAPATRLPASPRVVEVIVIEARGAGRIPEVAVEAVGGSVGRRIRVVHGFTASVPLDAVDALDALPETASVTPNRRVRLSSSSAESGFDPRTDHGSMYSVTEVVKARELWDRGVTGSGVDVALIDSGVSRVSGLSTPEKVVYGPDLSFESQSDSTRNVDTSGHGTHLAGIIAGRDADVPPGRESKSQKSFVGIAPGARIVSVKVATSAGATDVSQVLAAIDWVVQHRNSDGLNIRVLNLAFGTDGTQDYRLDPLTYAAEVAWRKGIVVVVAAGNRGFGTAKLNNPAYDPFVIAVGADDTHGTYPTSDDTIPPWSSRGDGTRNPDLVAPGKSIVSLRSPGSEADLAHPEGHVGDRFLRGSGTSQAAAVVAGAAALLVQQHPTITPDEVKHLMMTTAAPLPGADPVARGAGLLDLKGASKAAVSGAAQTWPPATGLGSLDAARGSVHLESAGELLDGERDIFGVAWDAATWSKTSWSDASWSSGVWNATAWSGDAWSSDGWSKTSWSGTTWSKSSWSGEAWSKSSWSSDLWSKSSWSAEVWSGTGWE